MPSGDFLATCYRFCCKKDPTPPGKTEKNFPEPKIKPPPPISTRPPVRFGPDHYCGRFGRPSVTKAKLTQPRHEQTSKTANFAC
ncbi:unnamed protein product, partial [Mesorhabditis spiculigera]